VLHFPARSKSGFSPSTFAHREALAIRVTMRARPSSARRASERIPSSHSLWWLDSRRAERAREYFFLAHSNGSTRGAPSERENTFFSLTLMARRAARRASERVLLSRSYWSLIWCDEYDRVYYYLLLFIIYYLLMLSLFNIYKCNIDIYHWIKIY